MSKNYSFSVSSKKVFIESTDNDDFLKMKIEAISSGENRNNSAFTEESLYDVLPNLLNRPVLAYFDKNIGDTQEHNSELKRDINGGFFYDYLGENERPVGIINESSDIKVEEINDKKWLSFTALIWTKYNKQLTDLLKKQKNKKVSVEIEVLESYVDENGVEIITKFNFLGVTILGEHIEEGIAGANLKLLDFVQSEQFNTYRTQLAFALKGSEKVFHNLTSNQLKDKLKSALSVYKCTFGDSEFWGYYIADFNDTSVFAYDNEDDKTYSISYQFIDDKCILDMSTKTQIETDKLIGFSQKQEVFIDKDKYGTGEKLEIDKSKEAMSDSAWGDVNKTQLRNNILTASNYKSLVKDVYLVVLDGWEDSPSSNLKYPVMELVDGKLVYNRNGLAAAKGYLDKNTGESYYKTAISKLNSIYKKLGLEDTKKEDMSLNKEEFAKKFSMTANDIWTLLQNAVSVIKYSEDEYTKYWMCDYNETYLFVYDYEEGGQKAIPYTIEGDDVICDFENVKEATLVSNWIVQEDETELPQDGIAAKFAEGLVKKETEKYCSMEKEMAELKMSLETMSAEKEELAKEKDDVAKEKETMSVEKEVLAKEKETLAGDLEMAKAELFKNQTEQFQKVVEEALAFEVETLEESTKEEFRTKAKEGKFASVEDFEKELAYAVRMFIKEKRAKNPEFKFGFTNVNSPKPEKDIFDELAEITKLNK